MPAHSRCPSPITDDDQNSLLRQLHSREEDRSCLAIIAGCALWLLGAVVAGVALVLVPEAVPWVLGVTGGLFAVLVLMWWVRKALRRRTALRIRQVEVVEIRAPRIIAEDRAHTHVAPIFYADIGDGMVFVLPALDSSRASHFVVRWIPELGMVLDIRYPRDAIPVTPKLRAPRRDHPLPACLVRTTLEDLFPE
jgi:hypothetical protein